jgi:hypothetical protein
MAWLLVALFCLSMLSGCGSSAAPAPTATVPPVPTASPTASQPRLTARRFLVAYMRGRRNTMISLMTPGLLRRNQHQFVSQMLGVDSPPGSFHVLRSRQFRSSTGRWTRVVVRLQLDHGNSLDWLGVVKTKAGWRISSIRQAKSSA